MSKKSAFHIFISAALTIVLLWAVFWEQSPREFFSLLLNVNKTWLFVYAGLSIVALVCRAVRYQLMLRDMQGAGERTPTTKEILIVTAIRNACVDLLPARLGELSFFYVLNRYGIPMVTAAATFGLCIALDMAVLAGLFLVLLVSAFLGNSVSIVQEITSPGILIGICGALILFFIIALRFLDRVLFFVAEHVPVVRIKRIITKLANDIYLVRTKRKYAQLVVLTVLLRAAKYVSLYVLLVAVVFQWGIGFRDVHPLLSFVAFLAGEAAASLPVSGLMGFGAYEGATGQILSYLGSEIPSITSVVFAVHVITQVDGYLLGVIAGLIFLVSQSRMKK